MGDNVIDFGAWRGGDPGREPWEEPWDDDWVPSGWDEPPPPPGDRWGGRDLGGLTQIVVIDGHVVDSVHREVVGSGYESAAIELGRGQPPPPPPPVEPPPVPRHEAQLAWLARIVGGEAPLAALTAEPLALGPGEVDAALAALPDHLRDRVEVMAGAVGEQALEAMGAEGRVSAVRVLVRAVRVQPALLGDGRDEVVGAAVICAAAKGNDLLGSGRPILGRVFTDVTGVRSVPWDRAARVRHALTGGTGRVPGWGRWQWQSPEPDVWALGSPDLLIGSFRRQRVLTRDLALRLRAAMPPQRDTG